MFSLPGRSTGSRKTARFCRHGLTAITYKTRSSHGKRKESRSKAATKGRVGKRKTRAPTKQPHGLTPAVSHGLLRKASARRQTLQRSSLHQNGFQQTGSISAISCDSFLFAMLQSFALLHSERWDSKRWIFALQQVDFACKEFMRANWPQIKVESMENHVLISLGFQQNFFV